MKRPPNAGFSVRLLGVGSNFSLILGHLCPGYIVKIPSGDSIKI